MAASIVSTAYGLALNPDKVLTLGNEEYVRTFSFGSAWTKIRLGICYSIRSTTSIGSASFVLGVCSGKTNPYAAATTTNFVGVNLTSSNSLTGTITANYGPPWYASMSGTVVIKRSGSTTTIGNGSGSILYGHYTAASLRAFMIVDITKGSPNYTLSVFRYVNVFNPYLDTAMFTAALNSISDPPTNALAQMSGVTIACDESAGAFDCFDLFWNDSPNPLDVGYLGATRLVI
jgi:hypothetical protein